MAVLADLGYDEGIDMLIESDAEEQADMIRAVRTPRLPLPPCACAVCPFSRSGLGCQVSSSPAVKKPIAKKFERELGKLRGQ